MNILSVYRTAGRCKRNVHVKATIENSHITLSTIYTAILYTEY